MKTLLSKVAAVVLALGLMAAPHVAVAQTIGGGYYFWFQAVSEDGEPFTEDAVVRCSVYGRNATTGTAIVHTSALLDTAYTAAAGLTSTVNGIIHWYSSTEDPVNLKCFTQYGDYVYKNTFTRGTHKVRIDTSGSKKIFRFPYVTNTAPTGTGLIIPSGSLVTGVAVERITILDGAHLNVGFAGNHAVASRNALMSQMAIDQRGFERAHLGLYTGTGVTDLNAEISVAGSHLGLALRHMVGSPSRSIIPRSYMVHVGSGLEITYTTSAGAGIGGHAYVFWEMLHLGTNRQPLR